MTEATDPETDPTATPRASNTEDDTPIPCLKFSTGNELYLFPLDMCEIRCPDCDRTYYPDSLGEALDWALGHKCDPEDATQAAAGGKEQ